jgi:integrase
MTSAVPLHASPVPAPLTEVEDRRLVVVRDLVSDDWLPGEWDAESMVLIPRADSLLARQRACVVLECGGRCNRGNEGLCAFHLREFDHSGAASLEEWLGAARAIPGRRRLTAERCAVTGNDGTRCARTARDPWGVCLKHSQEWSVANSQGTDFDGFLARARPLPGFGDCQAASCYRTADHRGGLCAVHYRLWITAGSPNGAARDAWLARVRAPSSGRVLSLRGLPELVRLEVLYAMQCRLADQARTPMPQVTKLVEMARGTGAGSVLDLDLATIDPGGNRDESRFARYALDRLALAYRDPETELTLDRWDLRVFGLKGSIDFTVIRQDWLREGAKRWAGTTMPRHRGVFTLQARIKAVGVLSSVLASGPGGGRDPAALTRRDVDRFLTRLRSMSAPTTGEALSDNSRFMLAKSAGIVVREATEMGFLPGLNPTFSFRRGDARWPVHDNEPGRALPAHVVAQLDDHLDLLRQIPGAPGVGQRRSLGVLVGRAGDVAVLAYQLLKGTGRRLGEIASLRLNCLDVDEHGKPVLVYDNHKAGRTGRRLPIADSDLVDAIRDQQHWVTERFPGTPPDGLWLLLRPNRNTNGAAHITTAVVGAWIKRWVEAIPRIECTPAAGGGDSNGFDRSAITPHAFRHTYAQTLADQGVAPSVLRDLMDHRNMNTTLGYYRVNEAKKRRAMELLARHTIDNRGTLRPSRQSRSRAAELREELSWVAVPMGKCSEPSNVRAGGQACPIRYQCAGCPHFESDPSYLPDLRSYADELRREREMLNAFNAADWVITNVTGQLDVIVDHIRRHEQLLTNLSVDQRQAIEDASRTVRKARQAVPVAFGRRHGGSEDD